MRIVILEIIALIVIALAALAAVSTKPYGAMARNSLLLRTETTQNLYWMPESPPHDYLSERQEPTALLRQAVDQAVREYPPASARDLDRAIALARYLGDNERRGGPIRKDTASAFRKIREQGRGYCADYSQVFLALALASDVSVREWGFGLDGFGSGHAFNEVFSRELGKWVFVDPFLSFYAVDADTRIPLSVEEFRTSISGETLAQGAPDIVPIDPGQFDFDNDREAIEYYARATDYFYLFWGDAVFSYDNDPWISTAGQVSRILEILVGIARGLQPAIAPLMTSGNEEAIQALRTARGVVLAVFAAVSLLSGLIVYQLLSRAIRRSTGVK